MRKKHLSHRDVERYFNHEMTPLEIQEMEEHIASCDDCHAKVYSLTDGSEYRQFVGVLAQVHCGANGNLIRYRSKGESNMNNQGERSQKEKIIQKIKVAWLAAMLISFICLMIDQSPFWLTFTILLTLTLFQCFVTLQIDPLESGVERDVDDDK